MRVVTVRTAHLAPAKPHYAGNPIWKVKCGKASYITDWFIWQVRQTSPVGGARLFYQC